MSNISPVKPTRPFSSIIDMLKAAGLRPTSQRLLLAKLLFGNGGRHISAEELHRDAIANHCSVSVATIYNTLKQFTAAGLLREIMVGPGRSYFDTTTAPHHHYFIEAEGKLFDIPDWEAAPIQLPMPPEGMTVTRVDLIVRLKALPAQ